MCKVGEQTAAGVGIDFDQTRDVSGEMKIVAHHDCIMPGIKTRYLGHLRLNFRAICGTAAHPVEQAQQFEHTPQGSSRQFDNGKAEVFVQG